MRNWIAILALPVAIIAGIYLSQQRGAEVAEPVASEEPVQTAALAEAESSGISEPVGEAQPALESPLPEVVEVAGIQHWTTEQGLKVYFVPADTLPMLDVRLVFNAGAARDGELPGLARMMHGLIGDAAGPWDADTIAERFEGVGANFSADSHRDMGVVSLRSLTEPDWLETALDTFVTVIGEARFEERSMERVRRQMQIGLQSLEQNPGALARRAVFANLYEGHPYGSPPEGTAESLQAITHEDLQGFYQQYLVNRNAVLIMVGGLDLTQAASVAERIASALPEGEAAAALPPAPAAPETAQVIEIPFPSEQVHIYMTHPGVSRDDPDMLPLWVANHRLGGGGFTSLLMDEVRSQRGLAYSVHSQFSPMAVQGPFMMVMQTESAQADEAMAVMRQTLEDFIDNGIGAEALAASQQNIIGGFPLRMASNSGILDHVALIGFYDLPLDYFETYTDVVGALTEEEVSAAFAQRIDPQRLTTVIVGGSR